MLKSLVVVTLCGCLLSLPRPASAYDGPFFSAAGSSRTVTFSRQMQKFVDSYIKDNDDELAEVRDRSSMPFTIIDSVMEHYDLPTELRYLAVIESELRAGAVSRVGAKGPWQLMAGTARELGLKVGRRADERTNFYKSTTAAALYLRDLHREFKDWLLVLAAYNAGPGPVYKAMRRAGSRNYWALERYLPRETRQHVKRFIATEYYFVANGPVVDPVRLVAPVVAQVPMVGPGPMVSLVPVVDPVSFSDPVFGDPGILTNPEAIQHEFPAVASVSGGLQGSGLAEGYMGNSGMLTDKYLYFRQ